MPTATLLFLPQDLLSDPKLSCMSHKLASQAIKPCSSWRRCALRSFLPPPFPSQFTLDAICAHSHTPPLQASNGGKQLAMVSAEELPLMNLSGFLQSVPHVSLPCLIPCHLRSPAPFPFRQAKTASSWRWCAQTEGSGCSALRPASCGGCTMRAWR